MSREGPNFIDIFVEYASVYNAPKRYLRWGAIWLLGTACLRRIGMQSRGQLLAPNMYVMMVGGPSVGKSQTCKAIESIAKGTVDWTYIPKSTTRAGLEDFLAQNTNSRSDINGSMSLSSECIGLADELQGVLPDQDLGHLTLYNIMYDLPSKHTAVTRTNGEVVLESPYCSMFTGAQPQFLAQVLPEAAWGMGFMSRTIMVFDVARERRSMFDMPERDLALQKHLKGHIEALWETNGYMTWTANAVDLYNEWWVKAGGNPVPAHKRLAMGYNGRRELHLAKLAMIMSLAHGTDLMVTEEDVAGAIRELLEAERNMTKIFDEMSNAGAMVAIEDVLELIRRNSARDQLTSEATLIENLMQRFPSTQVHSIITNLINSKAIKMEGGVNATGFREFGPGPNLGGL